jgi:hypothetical protein
MALPHLRLHCSSESPKRWRVELVRPLEPFSLPANPTTEHCLFSGSALVQARNLWWPSNRPADGDIWLEHRLRPYGVRYVRVFSSLDLLTIRIQTVEKMRDRWIRRPRAVTKSVPTAEFVRRFTFLERELS